MKKSRSRYRWNVKMLNEDERACIEHAERFFKGVPYRTSKIEGVYRLWVWEKDTSVVYRDGRFKSISHRH